MDTSVAPTGYSKGIKYSFWANHTNTGPATLNINGLGAKAIVRNDGAALTAGQITSGNAVIVVYDGTNFRLQNLTTNPTFSGQMTVGSLVSDGAITTESTITGSAFSGSGASLTNLNGSNISTGTVADDRLPTTMAGKTFSSAISVTGTATATLFSGSGASLTALNGSNISTGTVADDRLPGTMSSKTFTGSLLFTGDNAVASTSTSGASIIYGGTIGTGGGARLLLFGSTHASNSNQAYIDSNYINFRNTAGNGIPTLTAYGNTIWHAGNDGSGSGLDAGLLEGQNAAFFRNGSNINAGTVADARLPYEMAQKRFWGATIVNGTNNTCVWHQLNGVNRGLTYYDSGSNTMNWNLYNSSGNYVKNVNFRESDGRFTVPNELAVGSTILVGNARLYTDGNIQFAPGSSMANTYGGYLSDALAARIKNDGGTYGINVTGTSRYLKAVGGQNLNFDWNGQGGQPSWLWGGNDGTNMYVYNPANFSVAYAASAGNADTVDGLHEYAFAKVYYGTNANETNYPIGHTISARLNTGGWSNRNDARALNLASGSNIEYVSSNSGLAGTALSGTWRCRGITQVDPYSVQLFQRTA